MRFSLPRAQLARVQLNRHKTIDNTNIAKTKIEIIDPRKTKGDTQFIPPYITKYSTKGFVVRDTRIMGSLAVLPTTYLAWKVASGYQITPESLTLFTIVEPKIEILVLGVGDKTVPVSQEVRQFARDHHLSLEVQDTPNACAAFNFLLDEGRVVAAGLIPVVTLE